MNILSAANNIKNAKVVSIDRAEYGHYGYNSEFEIGIDVKTALDIESYGVEWTLITGKDPSQVMETIGEKFDFVIIDTEHSHPIESLNFLSVLPFLNDGAIVCLHDISLFAKRNLPSGDLATRILMCSLAGEKLFPKIDDLTNICAVQVSAETRSYIRSVFDALLIPWGVMPDETDLLNTKHFVEKHYCEGLVSIFNRAIAEQRAMLLYGKQIVNPMTFHFADMIQNLKNTPFIIYGAGRITRLLLDTFTNNGQFSFEIWDINAEKIEKIGGYKVSVPDFETPVESGVMIIMIENENVVNKIRSVFEPLGYNVYHGIHEFILKGFDR